MPLRPPKVFFEQYIAASQLKGENIVPELTLKQRIHAGETVIGVGLPYTADRDYVEGLLDRHAYDFCHVDVQHSPINEEAILLFCAIAHDFGLPIKMRIKHARDAYLIGNYLDLGLSGIEIPSAELESTVDEAINALFYPPTGRRSWGEPHSGPGIPTDRIGHAKWYDNYGMLWLQIESILGVTNARRLAKPGVDCFSFGPNDLNFDIETYPAHPLDSVDKCVKHVLEQLVGSTAAVCFRTTQDNRQKYADMGVTVFLEEPPHAHTS